jgi:hypothetical protein
VLARDVQRRPARDQRLQVRTAEQQSGTSRRGDQHVLEIVEHQQECPILQHPRQGVLERLAGHVPHVQCLADGRDHLVGGGQRRQRHPAHAVRKVGLLPGGHRQRQPGLARAASAGQGQQANIGLPPQPLGQSELTLAAQQRGSRAGQRHERSGPGGWRGRRRQHHGLTGRLGGRAYVPVSPR